MGLTISCLRNCVVLHFYHSRFPRRFARQERISWWTPCATDIRILDGSARSDLIFHILGVSKNGRSRNHFFLGSCSVCDSSVFAGKCSDWFIGCSLWYPIHTYPVDMHSTCTDMCASVVKLHDIFCKRRDQKHHIPCNSCASMWSDGHPSHRTGDSHTIATISLKNGCMSNFFSAKQAMELDHGTWPWHEFTKMGPRSLCDQR